MSNPAAGALAEAVVGEWTVYVKHDNHYVYLHRDGTSFTTRGDARFDGNPQGWVVFQPDSVHVPTVSDGEMLILYFLPGAAIEFL